MYRVFVAGAGASLYALDPRIQLTDISGAQAVSIFPADVEIDFCLRGERLHMILSRSPWCHVSVVHEGQDLDDGEHALEDGTHVTIEALSMVLMVHGHVPPTRSWLN